LHLSAGPGTSEFFVGITDTNKARCYYYDDTAKEAKESDIGAYYLLAVGLTDNGGGDYDYNGYYK
jgi:hypothetical protein